MSTEMGAYIGEFIGTAMLVTIGLSVIANISLKKSGMHGAGGLTAALGWGGAMTATAIVVGPISGAHVNPAFTIGFWIAGALPTNMLLGYFIAQILGAGLGALLVWLLFKQHLDEQEDADTKLGVFVTGPSINSPWGNVFAEAMATFMLMIVVLSFSAHGMPAGLPLVYVYIALSAGVMAFGGLTGYAINPARDLIPRLLYAVLPIKGKGDANFSYAWVPVIGPILGAAAAGLLHNFLATITPTLG